MKKDQPLKCIKFLRADRVQSVILKHRHWSTETWLDWFHRLVIGILNDLGNFDFIFFFVLFILHKILEFIWNSLTKLSATIKANKTNSFLNRKNTVFDTLLDFKPIFQFSNWFFFLVNFLMYVSKCRKQFQVNYLHMFFSPNLNHTFWKSHPKKLLNLIHKFMTFNVSWKKNEKVEVNHKQYLEIVKFQPAKLSIYHRSVYSSLLRFK